MVFEEGPFIQAACFCNMAIEDKDGTMSLIRIIDTVTHTERGPSSPEEMPPFALQFTLALMLKSGAATGAHALEIVPQLPTGETKEPVALTVQFEGEEKGTNVIVNVNFTFPVEGLYWFHVNLDGVRITSLPMRVRYNRLTTEASATTPRNAKGQ